MRGSRNNLTHCPHQSQQTLKWSTAKPEKLTVLLDDDPEMGIRKTVDVIKLHTTSIIVPTASNETFKNLDPFWGPFMSSHGGAEKKIDGYLVSLVKYKKIIGVIIFGVNGGLPLHVYLSPIISVLDLVRFFWSRKSARIFDNCWHISESNTVNNMKQMILDKSG